MSDSMIKSISPWFGSKRRLASTIVRELGSHKIYWELCCGSLAVLMSKSQAKIETVNDLHGDLINLARVIRHPILAPKLYRCLRRTLIHEEIFVESAIVYKSFGNCQAGDEPDLCRAYHYFISSWMGWGGVQGTTSYNQGYSVRYRGNTGGLAERFGSAVKSIPYWSRRLRRVVILNRDMFEIIDKINDSDEAAIYVDPPYIEKNGNYVHDFATEDHARLAKSLGRFHRARVVVSYYDHPILADLYPGWRVRRCDVSKSILNYSYRNETGMKAVAPEVLLVNDQDRTPLFGLYGGYQS